jgi:hypothetical protein
VKVVNMKYSLSDVMRQIKHLTRSGGPIDLSSIKQHLRDGLSTIGPGSTADRPIDLSSIKQFLRDGLKAATTADRGSADQPRHSDSGPEVGRFLAKKFSSQIGSALGVGVRRGARHVIGLRGNAAWGRWPSPSRSETCSSSRCFPRRKGYHGASSER